MLYSVVLKHRVDRIEHGHAVQRFYYIILSEIFLEIPAGLKRLIDPYQALLLFKNSLGDLFAFGLLIGATLGGNITPVGASANIAGIGILQKEGYKVSTKDFLRIGVPFTLIAAVSGALVIWLVWA